jgi:hypothetical protein
MAFIDNVSDNEEITDMTDVQNGTDIPAETIDLTMLDSDDEDDDIMTTFLPDNVQSNTAYIARLSALAARDAIADTAAIQDAAVTLDERRLQQEAVTTELRTIHSDMIYIAGAREDADALQHHGETTGNVAHIDQAQSIRRLADAALQEAGDNIRRQHEIIAELKDTPPPALLAEPITQPEIDEEIRIENEHQLQIRSQQFEEAIIARRQRYHLHARTKKHEPKRAKKTAPKHALKPAPARKPAPEPTPAPARKPAPEPTPAPARKPAPEPTPAPARKPAPEPETDEDDDRKPAAKTTPTQDTAEETETDEDDHRKPAAKTTPTSTPETEQQKALREQAERVVEYRQMKAAAAQKAFEDAIQKSQGSPPKPTNPYAKNPRSNIMMPAGKDGKPIRWQPEHDPTRTMVIDPFSGMAPGQITRGQSGRSKRVITERRRSAIIAEQARLRFLNNPDFHKAASRLMLLNDIDISKVFNEHNAITHLGLVENPSLRGRSRRGPPITAADRTKFENGILNRICKELLKNHGYNPYGLNREEFERIWAEFISDYMFAYHLQQVMDAENASDTP